MSDVSAVIVNYEGGDRLLRTVGCLERQAVPLERILVVDNGSQDGSPERLRRRFPRVEVIETGENRGLPVGRNVGLRAAPSELVLLVDADVYVEEDCVARLRRALLEEGAAVACPRVRLLPERETVQADGASAHFLGTMALRHGYRQVGSTPARRSDVDGCMGACMLVRREDVLRAGGFEELIFLYQEDHEFSLRMRALGHGIVCEPAAVVYHDRGRGTADLSYRGRGPYPRRRLYHTLQSRLLIILVHYRLRTLLVLAPALFLHEAAALAVAAMRGWAVEWARAWLWQWRNVDAIRVRRRRMQATRIRHDRELLRGGSLPLTPGLARSGFERAAARLLGSLLDLYWRITRPLVG